MLTRFTALTLLLLSILSSTLHAQAQAPTDDQQAAQDQMRTMFQTMMQNMQDKGIDPRTFFQQMQSGADPADIQKQLIDQGIIDQKMIDQMQSTMQSLQASTIKAQLNPTDDEWKTLWPLIQKVLTASAAINGTRAGGGGMMGGGMGFMTAQPANSDLAKATRALRQALKDPTTSAEQFTAVLSDYRSERAKAQATLNAARQDLTSVLTVRQEAILATMGILE